jgi:hypothetical protein
MSKVVSINGDEYSIDRDGTPSLDLVEKLEAFLDEARSGVLVNISYAVVRNKGGHRLTAVGWEGDGSIQEQAFGIALLQGQFQKELVGRLDEV